MSENDFFLVSSPVETDEETVALLKYMLDHNRQHTKELVELAQRLNNDAENYVLSAAEDFDRGNEKLLKALSNINK